MRIIAGRFKGLRLPSPRSKSVRPTADRVREAIFSSIEPLIDGARVLELFAGTGAFGFEALSRGADAVVFVEKDRKTAGALSRTVRTLGVQDSVSILNRTASQAVKWLQQQGAEFRIIFLDPPYEDDWVSRLFLDPGFSNLLSAGGVVIVERSARAGRSNTTGEYGRRFERKYGDTLVEIFDQEPNHVVGSREVE